MFQCLGEGERPQCQAMRDRVVELKRAARAAAKGDKAKAKNGLSFASWMVRPGGSGELSGFLKRAEACAGTGAIVL